MSDLAMPLMTVPPVVLGAGAWLKNRACGWQADASDRAGALWWSELNGDLSDPAACQALQHTLTQWMEQHGRRVQAIAHDLHPDFFSTQCAQDLAERYNILSVAVQHHHAHIAAVMAEHGLHWPVIGLALDGVGLGSDHTAWGGELLCVQPDGTFERLAHCTTLPMIGGDRAAYEPWRLCSAVMALLGQGYAIAERFAPYVGVPLANGLQQWVGKVPTDQLGQQTVWPRTTAAGRWFDAAAAALGLCYRQEDEAQAPIALEKAATRWLGDHACTTPDLLRAQNLTPLVDAMLCQTGEINMLPLLSHLLQHTEMRHGHIGESVNHAKLATDRDELAAVFHTVFAEALCLAAERAAQQHRLRDVCLGGGCFFNRILSDHMTARLPQLGFRVHRPLTHSCGDAGIALGQAWVAAQRLRLHDRHDRHESAVAPSP